MAAGDTKSPVERKVVTQMYRFILLILGAVAGGTIGAWIDHELNKKEWYKNGEKPISGTIEEILSLTSQNYKKHE